MVLALVQIISLIKLKLKKQIKTKDRLPNGTGHFFIVVDP